MFELPEIKTLEKQIRAELVGRSIVESRGAVDRPKFLFVSPEPPAFDGELTGQTFAEVESSGKCIYFGLSGGKRLVLGETGGRLGLHVDAENRPKKPHWSITFDDGRSLTLTIQMWGFLGLMTDEEIEAHPYLGPGGPSPVGPGFTPEAFDEAIDRGLAEKNVPIKAFLIHRANIDGIGNGYLQDILWASRISPKRKLADLSGDDRAALHQAIAATMRDAMRRGGRDTELDLYGRPGSYVPRLDRRRAGGPCPECGTPIERIQYLGGSCYVCPVCQI